MKLCCVSLLVGVYRRRDAAPPAAGASSTAAGAGGCGANGFIWAAPSGFTLV